MIVYERNVAVGGLLRYGIPTMKLGKDVRSHMSLSVCLYVCLCVCLVDGSCSIADSVNVYIISTVAVRAMYATKHALRLLHSIFVFVSKISHKFVGDVCLCVCVECVWLCVCVSV